MALIGIVGYVVGRSKPWRIIRKLYAGKREIPLYRADYGTTRHLPESHSIFTLGESTSGFAAMNGLLG